MLSFLFHSFILLKMFFFFFFVFFFFFFIDLNYKKEWDVCLITKSYLVIILKLHSWYDLGALLTEIMPWANTQLGLLFRLYKRKLTRSVNNENAVRQASRANVRIITSFRESIQSLIRNKNSF